MGQSNSTLDFMFLHNYVITNQPKETREILVRENLQGLMCEKRCAAKHDVILKQKAYWGRMRQYVDLANVGRFYDHLAARYRPFKLASLWQEISPIGQILGLLMKKQASKWTFRVIVEPS